MRHERNFWFMLILVTVIMSIPLLGTDTATHVMFVGKNQII